MTLEEAKKVAEVCRHADGGCSHCVRGLEELLNEILPEFVWTYRDGTKEEDWSPNIEVSLRAP